MTSAVSVVATSSADLELELEVVGHDRMSADVVAVTLRSRSTMLLPTWTPGAHVDLRLPGGRVRQYSLCGSPGDRSSWRVGVLREAAGRGGSAYVHDELRVGDVLTATGPRNHFELKRAPRYLFLAGGIGVTPLIPMVEECVDRGADVSLVYCARSRESMAFLSEVGARLGNDLVVNADDESGLFDLAGYLSVVRDHTLVYACGPGPFLDAVTAATGQWPPGTVHMERFTPLDLTGAVDAAFEVELRLSGRTLDVPADKSILEVLRENAVPILSSCTEGTCGTCEVVVLAGEVDHRDVVLSPEERDTGEMMMVCVSRCRGPRLVLDL